jgi:hypothetical protein
MTAHKVSLQENDHIDKTALGAGLRQNTKKYQCPARLGYSSNARLDARLPGGGRA